MPAYVIKQEKFEGPLEVLLELIEKEKLSISEISLAKVTDDYIQYVRSLEKIYPESLAEFLVVAAQLMLVKSRSLLPNLELTQEEEASIEELERRLEEYGRIREVMKDLKNLELLGYRIGTRDAYLGIDPMFYPPPKLTLEKLKDAFSAFLVSLPKIEKLAEEKIKKVISLEEKISHIRSILVGAVERAFSEIIKGTKEKVEIIVSFLAILELAKQKFINLSQAEPFDDIMIKKIGGGE